MESDGLKKDEMQKDQTLKSFLKRIMRKTKKNDKKKINIDLILTWNGIKPDNTVSQLFKLRLKNFYIQLFSTFLFFFDNIFNYLQNFLINHHQTPLETVNLNNNLHSEIAELKHSASNVSNCTTGNVVSITFPSLNPLII